MNKFFCAILSVLIFQSSFAGVLTVSNATVSPGQYASITAAIAAASAGDTILVHGTGINYGGFSVTKKLVFIGPGHNPTDKQNINPALIDDISLGAGSSDSKFYGLNVNRIFTSNTITSILISNCYVRNKVEFAGYQSSNNWIIDGCVFATTGQNIDGNGLIVSNLRIRNCVFNGYIYNFSTGSGYNYINNCVFLSGVNQNTFQFCYYFYVNNSIFYRAIPRQSNGWVSFEKCLSYQTIAGGPAFSGNSNGVARTVYENVDPQFESLPLAGAYFDYAHDYRLKVTSTVKGMGTDATDLGVYGGTEFSNTLIGYNHFGIPLNPYIKVFNITGTNSVNAGDNLQISVEAKVRN